VSEHRLAAVDAGRTLEVAAGDRVLVALDERPGTGYTWTVEALPSGARLEEHYEHGDGGIGGESRHIFTIAPAGDGVLVLLHRRPWEPPESAIDRFEVTLRGA
jgi:inhibitor of cysteine peptidase